MSQGRSLGLGLSLVLVAGPLLAHHGDAGRFQEELTTLYGTVVALQLKNPHPIIVFGVEDESGTLVTWQAELGSARGLAENFGWTTSTLKPGDRIALTGRVVRSGAPYINLTERARLVSLDTCEELFRTGVPWGVPPEGQASDLCF